MKKTCAAAVAATREKRSSCLSCQRFGLSVTIKKPRDMKRQAKGEYQISEYFSSQKKETEHGKI